METKTDVAYFCPACGSASLDTQELTQTAECRVCPWSGPGRELLMHRFEHGFLDSTEALRALSNDMRIIFAASAKLIGEFLLKWGFVTRNADGSVAASQLLPYVASMAQAALKAVITEREKQEKRSNG